MYFLPEMFACEPVRTLSVELAPAEDLGDHPLPQLPLLKHFRALLQPDYSKFFLL